MLKNEFLVFQNHVISFNWISDRRSRRGLINDQKHQIDCLSESTDVITGKFHKMINVEKPSRSNKKVVRFQEEYQTSLKLIPVLFLTFFKKNGTWKFNSVYKYENLKTDVTSELLSRSRDQLLNGVNICFGSHL